MYKPENSVLFNMFLLLLHTEQSQSVKASVSGRNTWFPNRNNLNKFRRNRHRNEQKKVRRREGSEWCEGTCTNILLCSIRGGETATKSSCKGMFSVCCLPQPVQFRFSSQDLFPEQNRVPRQLTLPPLRLPRPVTRLVNFKRQPPGSPPRNGKPTLVKTGAPAIQIHQVKSESQAPVVQGVQAELKTKYNNIEDVQWHTKVSIPRPSQAINIPGKQITYFQTSQDNNDLSEFHNEIFQGSAAQFADCGVSQTVADERILGGQDAGYGQFPWTALIQIKGRQLDKMCAGTLVSNRFIITAGHCVRYCNDGLLPNCSNPIPFSDLTFKVVLGEYDVNNQKKGHTIQRYHATNVYIHPEFTNIFRLRDNGFLESEPQHDVALLKLDRHVKPSINIGSICLPLSSLYLEPGTLATVTGWGRLGVHDGAPHSSTLQAVTVPVLTREECMDQPGASIPTDDQLCAGLSNSRQSSCPGDSGGGLMIRDENYRWSLIGIVSTGPAECGLTPVIYHNVPSSLGWIKRTMVEASRK